MNTTTKIKNQITTNSQTCRANSCHPGRRPVNHHTIIQTKPLRPLPRQSQATAGQLSPYTHPFTLTKLAFLLNFIIGHPHDDLSMSEVRAAVRDSHLLQLLAARYDPMIDFYNLTHNPSHLRETEAALSAAAKSLLYGESTKIGVSTSGPCLALAIVLEAIQQTIHTVWPPSQFKAKQANSKEFKDPNSI